MRHANGLMYMDIEDLRKGFSYTNWMQDKIRDFKRDRVSLILANECVGNLGHLAKLVIHIIPEWSFEIGSAVDLKLFTNNSSLSPISGSSWRGRYNADGYCIYETNHSTNLVNTYTQFFRNGIVEATEIRLISGYKEKMIYNWADLHGILMRAVMGYGNQLDKMNIPKPWHISATLLNAKGYTTDTGFYISKPIEREIVNSIEGVCSEDCPLQDAFKQVLNSLANAFGMACE